MATVALDLIHERYQVTAAEGRKPLTLIYKKADVAQDAFTRPISLEGARCVWVHIEGNLAAEFYIPGLLDEATATSDSATTSTSASGTNEFYLADEAGYFKMASTTANAGMNVVPPSSAGAGFIAGDCMPPMLSVKCTGGNSKDIYIFVSY